MKKESVYESPSIEEIELSLERKILQDSGIKVNDWSTSEEEEW